MKKVFINYNSKDNFGDDLFVKILCGYFPKQKFLTLVPKGHGVGLEGIKNLKISHIASSGSARKQYYKTCYKADGCICLGGSAFTEPNEDLDEFWDFKYIFAEGPLCHVSADFGPYTNIGFKGLCEEYFTECDMIWFRDRLSMSEIQANNVWYAPDLAFALEMPRALAAKRKYAVIAPIDLSGRFNVSMVHDEYMRKLGCIAEYLKKNGYDIITLALCPNEWDDRVAYAFRGYGAVMRYDGKNTDQILSVIGGAACVVSSRLHAIIPAIMSDVPVLPIFHRECFKSIVQETDSNISCFDVTHLGELTEDVIGKTIKYKPNADKAKMRKDVNEALEKVREFINL